MPITVPLPQITRIPITGPHPFNTLVCLQTTSNGGPQDVRPGKTSRYPLTVETPFRLAGFDQRIVPVFAHSTTAFLSSIGPAEDDTWLYAVDAVTGAGFDQVDGFFFVNIDMAILPGEPVDSECVSYGDPTQGGFVICDYLLTVQIVSYILCHEPVLPTQSPGSPAMVSKVPLRRAQSLSEHAALQLGKPVTLNPKRHATSVGQSCDCADRAKM